MFIIIKSKKDGRHNCQMKKEKTNNEIQNMHTTQKNKDRATRTALKPG
jgi:hypothetical protein